MRARATGNVSATLLQKMHSEQTSELQQLRDALFSLAKEHGRLRFSKKTLAGLTDDDGINIVMTAEGDYYIVTYEHRSAQDAGPKESA